MVSQLLKIRVVIILLWILVGSQEAMAEVRVDIDRNPVQVNESFQLVFSADQSPDRDPDFSILQQHFLILGSTRSNSISIINGEYQRSVKWTLKLMAKRVGEFMVPAIRFDQYRSKPLQITVQPSRIASVPNNQLVLELLVDKPVAYVQSQLILTLRLLSATNISAYEFGDIKIEDVDTVVESLGDELQYQTRIGDKTYLVLEKKLALFPQQSGRLAVPPVIAEVRLRSASKFDPFRSGGEIRQLRSQPLTIDVEPIPAEFVGPYWLPAQSLELREQWQGDIDKLVAGEPVTRSLTLIADGLTAAQLPELVLSQIDGIKQYPDQPGLENSLTSKGVSGSRQQKVALIPGAAGSYLLPEISVPWWNLQTGKMETAIIPAREISVSAAVNTVVPVSPAVSESPAVAPQILSENIWLWISLLLASGWILSVLYWWFSSRRRRQPSKSEWESPNLSVARKRLGRACDADDAVAARQALLAWGRAMFAPGEVGNLIQLANLLGSELGGEIEKLNQSLYAEAGTPWRGRDLWSLCQQFEIANASTSQASGSLLPLNPGT
ncbi:MAG: protein BatD [Gammaproteobacteria bacterium]|nr:protein BatD [Gammaproteobacteria bacterium]